MSEHKQMDDARVEGFRTGFPQSFLTDYQRGVMGYTYRGRQCWKSPIDLAIYLKLLWDAQPRTIIEVGSKDGGSALWFADMVQAMGMQCAVVTVDIEPPTDLEDPRITVLRGDSLRLSECLTSDLCATLPRPWWICEDSAHTFATTLAALRFFHPIMQAGERLVVEDGVLDDLGWSERYEGGPNRAVAQFLAENPGSFEIDRSACDMFGRNVTYCPNGYLIKR